MRTVIHQIDLESPVPGGIDTCILDLIKLHPDGFEVVGVARSQGAKAEIGVWRQVEGVRFLAVARLPTGARRVVPHSLRLVFGLWRFRKRIAPERIQAHRPEVGLCSKWIFKRSLVQFLHGDGTSGVSRHSDSLFRWAPPLFFWIEKMVCSAADEVVVFSEPGFRRLEASGVSGLKQSSTWYEPQVFSVHRVSTRPHRVLWVGRFEQPKDPLLALDSFSLMVPRLDPGSHLTMVGDGSLLPTARAHAERLGIDHAVRFTGALGRLDVARMMQTHSVTIATSHFEGMSRSMLESMACGTPVVSTSEGDPARTIVTGVSGIRVESRRPIDIAEAALSAIMFDRGACAGAVERFASNVVISELLS